MPQSVYGSGYIPLKPGCSAEVAALAREFDGWLEWDEFSLSEEHLAYAYNAVVGIGTASDLDDFLLEIAEKHAARGWAHYSEDDEVTYFGPTDRDRLDAEIADLERRSQDIRNSLSAARAKQAALTFG